MPKRILLADDQVPAPDLRTRKEIREFYLKRYADEGFADGFVFLFDLLAELRDNAYQVKAVNRIMDVEAAMQGAAFDAIILDLGWFTEDALPFEERMSKGWELAEALKQKTSAPIIMFSNRFPEKNNLAEIAAERGLFPVFKSYDPTCIKNLLVTLKYHVTATPIRSVGRNVFIGHGHSPLWLELKAFLEDELKLGWEEFNRTPVEGLAVTERLKQMLDSAGFALLVLTAEDEHAAGDVHARENVVHEVGLFQGRLGFEKAIVLLEDGCQEFSNLSGLQHIAFPRGDIKSAFEKVKRVLQREGLHVPV